MTVFEKHMTNSYKLNSSLNNSAGQNGSGSHTAQIKASQAEFSFGTQGALPNECGCSKIHILAVILLTMLPAPALFPFG